MHFCSSLDPTLHTPPCCICSFARETCILQQQQFSEANKVKVRGAYRAILQMEAAELRDPALKGSKPWDAAERGRLQQWQQQQEQEKKQKKKHV